MEIDFGTYHHSTKQESENFRKRISELFKKAFSSVIQDPSKVLDAGCGLGFLSSVVMDYFKNTIVYGVDNFQDTNLKDNSIEKLRKNISILGFDKRFYIISSDLTGIPFRDNSFDVIVSNLVYHNIKDRDVALQELVRILKPYGFILLGDLFFYRLQLKNVDIVSEIYDENLDKYKIVILKKVI
ncbi:MAG: class I SAM-dependent methyltransferase [Acidianus sp.]|jgi:ubiquinone/menaquinone biosynthesis C-methylase UbiE|nr:class I SAM-dependent methyltransferase [Acidianus sp.]